MNVEFRGLSYHSEKEGAQIWVYGYFCGCPSCVEIYSAEHMQKNGKIIGQITALDGSYGNVGVLDGTVGQYIGMTDIDDNKIYEGDLVEAWSQGVKAVGEVKRRVDGLWLMYPAWQSGESWILAPNSKGETTVKVIGNIHQ